MSQKKKMTKLAHQAYKLGFSDASEFWELALMNIKGIGPKRRKAIQDRVSSLIEVANIVQQPLDSDSVSKQ